MLKKTNLKLVSVYLVTLVFIITTVLIITTNYIIGQETESRIASGTIKTQFKPNMAGILSDKVDVLYSRNRNIVVLNIPAFEATCESVNSNTLTSTKKLSEYGIKPVSERWSVGPGIVDNGELTGEFAQIRIDERINIMCSKKGCAFTHKQNPDNPESGKCGLSRATSVVYLIK